MFNKITSLVTLQDYILLVGFSDNVYKKLDLKPFIEKYQPFKSLLDIDGLYEQAKIDIGGYGIVWNDELDISADGIYEKGVSCSPPNNIETLNNQLIEELIMARKQSKVSQKQLEVLSGIPQPCIARIEKGGVDSKVTTILKILEPLGLTLSVKKIEKNI